MPASDMNDILLVMIEYGQSLTVAVSLLEQARALYLAEAWPSPQFDRI